MNEKENTPLQVGVPTQEKVNRAEFPGTFTTHIPWTNVDESALLGELVQQRTAIEAAKATRRFASNVTPSPFGLATSTNAGS